MTSKNRKSIHKEYLNPRFGYFYTVAKTLYRGRTGFQNIRMVDTPEFGKTLLLDGITQVVTKNHYQYHEPLAHPAMCCHPRPETVLIIGGGDGGTLREVVRYKTVRKVDLAELDKGVIRFSIKYLKQVHKGAFNDKRVTVHIVDGRSFVNSHPGTYDVVIMDMTDPFGPSRYLYTKEFFEAVKKSLTAPNGIFAMHTESPISRPDTYNSIISTLRLVYKYVQPMLTYIQMYAALWSISICSDNNSVVNTGENVIDRRLRSSGIRGLEVFSGKTFSAMKTSYPYIDKLLKCKARVLTDRKPDVPDIVH